MQQAATINPVGAYDPVVPLNERGRRQPQDEEDRGKPSKRPRKPVHEPERKPSRPGGGAHDPDAPPVGRHIDDHA